MNDTIDKFLNDLVECLKDYDKENDKVDIAFLVAPLYQALEKPEYFNFVSDLEEYSDYSIEYNGNNDKEYYCANGKIIINLNKWLDEGKGYREQFYPKYNYEIIFEYDSRLWGYCECSPEDEDYREDKDCCGHGCDWYAPSFTLNKVITIEAHNWEGDEHDYWDFEDQFYKSEKDLAATKKEQEKKIKKESLQRRLEEVQKQLAELESEE